MDALAPNKREEAMKIFTAALVVLFLVGCGDGNGRYQIVSSPNGPVWRLDTKTGDLELCGFNFGSDGKMTCTLYPRNK